MRPNDYQKLKKRFSGAGKLLGLAAAYFIAGKLGTLLAIPPGYATAVWAPSGIAVAGILLYGYRFWPGVWIGSVLVNFLTTFHSTIPASLSHTILLTGIIGLGASAQAVAASYLIRRYAGLPESWDNANEVLAFLILGGPVSCLISATVGATTLFYSGAIPAADYGLTWMTWWIGDAIGVIVFAPLILTAVSEEGKLWSRRRLSVVLPLAIMFLLVVLLFLYASQKEQTQRVFEFRRRSTIVAEALEAKFENNLWMLNTTERFLTHMSPNDRPAFHEFVNSLASEYPGLKIILWEPLFLSDKFVHPLFMHASPLANRLFGAGFASQPAFMRALREARDTGRPVGVPYVRQISPGVSMADLVVFSPVYKKSISHSNLTVRRNNLQGYIIGILRVDDIAASVFKGLAEDGMNLTIFDVTSGSDSVMFYTHLSPFKTSVNRLNPKSPQLEDGIAWKTPMHIANRQWVLKFSQSKAYLIAHPYLQAWTVMVSGLFFTGILGAFLLVVTGRTFKIETLVAQRTASLEASESRLRSMMESAQDAIFACDREGKIISWNHAAERSFGYLEAEILGQSVSIILPLISAGYAEKEIAANFSEYVGKTIEFSGIKKDGTEIPLEISIASWKMNEEHYFSGFLRDITERRKIDQLKTDLVSFASHQLKTPAAEVKGLAENMLQGLAGELSAQQRKYLTYIQETSTRNLQLITALLNISKIEAGTISMTFSTVKLSELVRRIVEDYASIAAKKWLSLIVEETEKEILVKADQQKMIEALRNVMDNAVRLTSAGKIIITIRGEPKFGIVDIQDTGPGIDAEILPKLFTKELLLASQEGQGSGLGLYIAKSFMKLQQGDVSVISMEGGGSKFTFKLPRA